jgi:hypothetical protein
MKQDGNVLWFLKLVTLPPQRYNYIKTKSQSVCLAYYFPEGPKNRPSVGCLFISPFIPATALLPLALPVSHTRL